jgi:DNA-directed RNA polymerase subunit RPC12/RpoP
MSDDSMEVLCERCGQTFSAFLHEMAKQNEKVVCPDCRTNPDCKPTKTAKPTAGPRTVRKTN